MPPKSAEGIAEVVQLRTPGYGGGVNMRDAVTQLAGDEARAMENGVLDERGSFTKRLGCLSKGIFGATGDRVLSMYTFYRALSVPELIIHTSGGKIYKTTDPNAEEIVWTEIATGKSTSRPFNFETFNSKLYMGNGVDDYAWWDGTTYTTIPTAPKGRFLRLWKDTMWVSGIDAYPDRVYSSDAGNAETFPIANWVDIAKGDGDIMSALATDGTFLIPAKRRRVSVIYDPGTFANRMVDYEKGFESHLAVIQWESTLFFLSRRGICEWYNDAPAKIISGKVDPLFSPTFLNLAALNLATAYAIDQRVGWCLPEAGGTALSFQLEYYPRLAGVTQYGNRGTGPFVFHRMPVTCFARYRYGSDERLFGGALAANKVYQLFGLTGQDDGQNFSGYVESGALDLGEATKDKYLRRLRHLGRGKFYCSIKENFAPSTSKTHYVDMAANLGVWGDGEWGEGVWGPSSTIQEDRWHPDIFARYFTFVFTDAEDDTATAMVPLGTKLYKVDQGAWTILWTIIEASVLGVRD